ncbi:MAG TPA: phosphonate metabolism protein/1,5-bisphosphokinase (PRPP-forming) PhnN [Xanthobacteraceae bacterium]|jgi:ribose 1,5-bisphosphokinase|nr:phosphonate metabolism protein/1,5-bisphosphokinase (PRPP-forming) PhnN [Xanthobacteraceae bacterium]
MSEAVAARIGPGTLVAVVGPSGAGKDTLIALARAECTDNSRIVFPRRVITRASSIAEEHDCVSPAEFEAARSRGHYAFSWDAHGLKYALPAEIDADLSAGRTVICNVSRAVVGELRERYAKVVVVLVTAPKEILIARLAGRGREDDRGMAVRLERALADDFSPDVVIENVGDPQIGAARLVEVLREEAAVRPALGRV